jgi:hypothetical protein
MTEELGVGERIGKRTHVERHEFARALAQRVQRPRHHVFAGPRLSLQEHALARASMASDLFRHALHRQRAADQARNARRRARRRVGAGTQCHARAADHERSAVLREQSRGEPSGPDVQPVGGAEIVDAHAAVDE